MAYDSKDIIQQAIGAFSAVFFIFILRGGDPLFIDPQLGLILGLVWLGVLYVPLMKSGKEARTHFIGSIIVSIAVTSSLAMLFGLAQLSDLTAFKFFGSSAWLIALMAVPVANLFDKQNVMDIISRYYIRGGRPKRVR